MYVVSRVLSFEKGYIESLIEGYKKTPVMLHFPGFIRRDILLDQKNPARDVMRILIYWESKQAFYRFEGSPLHISLHRDKTSSHVQKPEGLIDMHREAYEVIASDIYVEAT